jgi:hypothetical protein
MKLIRNRATSLLGAGLLAGGALAAMVSPAQAATTAQQRVTVTLCAEGNYTAYAKVVAEDGSLSMDLTHVPAGQCATNSVLLNSSSLVRIWLFGIYNVSHKGFDVCKDGGAAGTATPGFSGTFHVGGTTTDPVWLDDLARTGCR